MARENSVHTVAVVVVLFTAPQSEFIQNGSHAERIEGGNRGADASAVEAKAGRMEDENQCKMNYAS